MDEALLIVIGHFPDYLRLARRLSARAFLLDPDVYESMTEEARWSANTNFIDRAIADSCTIVLTAGPGGARVGSVFEREIAYLRGLGWRMIRQNGRWEMIR